MKFALVTLTLFALFEAYNARPLHDASIKESYLEVAVIQLVNGEEKLRLPQSSTLSSSYDQTTYGHVLISPSLRMSSATRQATYGRENVSPSPSSRMPPSKSQATYVRVNPSPPPPPNEGPSEGQETYGKVNPSPRWTPNEIPSQIQTFYPGDKPNSNNETYDAATEKLEVSPKQDGSMEQTKYGRDDPTNPPSPDPSDSQGQSMLGRVNLSAPATTKPTEPTHPVIVEVHVIDSLHQQLKFDKSRCNHKIK